MAAHLLLETGDVLLLENGDSLRREETFFDDVRQAIINGLDSAQSEANGWDIRVKAALAVTDVVRTSATVVTITLDAEAAYDITAQETITVTIPASAILATGPAMTAEPTFTVDTVASGGRTTKNTRAFPLGMEIGMNWVSAAEL